MNTDFEVAKTASMEALVEYAKDAVVSKTLIKKDTGTVTLFAFDKGQGLSEHTAPFNAMVHVIEGEAVILIDRKGHTLKTGEFIIMPANITHAIDATQQFKMVLTMIKSK